MSSRGAKFLEQWVSNHIMDHTVDGLLSANELAARAIADALKEGIPVEVSGVSTNETKSA